MTISGWLQIALFCVIVILITRPLGGYMTRVFNGERTFLSLLYGRSSGVSIGAAALMKKKSSTGLSMAFRCCSSASPAFSPYGLQRLQWYLPFTSSR